MNKKNEANYKLLVEKQSECLELILASLQSVNVKDLWQKRSIDEEFAKYYLDTALKMLENKILMDSGRARETVFSILHNNLLQLFHDPDRVDELQQLKTKVINLLYEDENLVEPIVELLVMLNNNSGNSGSNRQQHGFFSKFQ